MIKWHVSSKQFQNQHMCCTTNVLVNRIQNGINIYNECDVM